MKPPRLPEACQVARESMEARSPADDAHVAGCASCQAYARAVEHMDGALDQAGDDLDEVTRARVEARVLAALDAPPAASGLPRIAAAITAVAVAAAAVLLLWPARQAAVDAGGLGPVAVIGFEPSPELAAALLGGRVAEARAPAGGRVRLHDARGAVFELEGPGELGAPPSGHVALASGLVRVDVAPGRERTVVIEAGGVDVAVKGTRFFVARWAGEPVRVGVSRGSVEVRAGATTATVGPGQAWSAATGVVPLGDDERAALEALRASWPAPAGLLRLRAPGVELADAAGPLGTGPLLLAWGAGPAELVLTPSGGRSGMVRADVRGGEVTELDALPPGAGGGPASVEPPDEPGSGASPGTATPPRGEARAADAGRVTPVDGGGVGDGDGGALGLDAEALYQRAERAMAAQDTVRAAGYLDTLIRLFPRDPLVASALYERARLAVSVGDRKVARGALATLLDRREGAGAVAEPAHYLACRVELEDARRAAARACLIRFRGQFPASIHDRDALVALAQLDEREGGCGAARPWLEALVAAYPRDVAGQDALSRLERCAP